MMQITGAATRNAAKEETLKRAAREEAAIPDAMALPGETGREVKRDARGSSEDQRTIATVPVMTLVGAAAGRDDREKAVGHANGAAARDEAHATESVRETARAEAVKATQIERERERERERE